jgi:predicted acetyltransferase
MMGDMVLHPLAREEYPIVPRLWQLYRHDLSEFRGSLPDAQGRYTDGYMPRYLTLQPDPDRTAYLIRWSGAPAGFVFVRGLTGPARMIAEFFVVRAVRRQGVGEAAARAAFGRHPGPWEVAFQEENPAAARLWRRVVGDVSDRAYREERRPVPDKPHLPPDTWLRFTTGG